MKNAVQLYFRHQPSWASHQRTYVRGHAFFNNDLLSAKELAQQFDLCAGDPKKFQSLLKKLNGFFSVVHQSDKNTLAAVDIIRSIPLFYSESEMGFFISDEARWVRNSMNDMEREQATEWEFQLVGYVTGRDTLYQSVKQIQAGELIEAKWDSNGLNVHREYYFRHIHNNYFEESEDKLLDRLDASMTQSFKRLIEYANGRTIALSLSGGYDSRLIGLMLRRLNYKNVICFSFGKPQNSESKVSQYVADKLGYKWVYAPIVNSDWSKLYDSDERRAHDRFCDGLCSLPQILHWPAIRNLIYRDEIPEESIIVPGVAADLPAGSYSVSHPELYEDLSIDLDQTVLHILYCHYGLWPLTQHDIERARYRIMSNIARTDHYADSADIFEEWFTREKVAKLVVNSVRTYEFCEREWWLPYFDKSFIEFWLQVHPRDRICQKLYSKYLERISRLIIGTHIPSLKSSSISILKARVRNRLDQTHIWTIYSWLKRMRLKRNLRRLYDEHPMASYGMVPFSIFTKHIEYARNENSFLAYFYLQQGIDRN